MNRWSVMVKTGMDGESWDKREVEAQTMRIESGCLVFRDVSGGLVLAYGVGGWFSIMPIPGPAQ